MERTPTATSTNLERGMMQPASYPRHLRVLLWSLCAPLAALAAFNLVADPFHCFRLLKGTQLYRSAAGLGNRQARGEMIAHFDWDVLLLGTSRVQLGLDPLHPAFAHSSCSNCELRPADSPDLA